MASPLMMAPFTREKFWGTFGAQPSSWGGHMIGGAGLATGFGLHWMPARRGRMVVPGPGVAASHFADRAADQAFAIYDVDCRGVIEKMAVLAENYCNRPVELGVTKAGGEYGGIFGGTQIYLKGHHLLQYYADENISEGLRMVAEEAHAMWLEAAEKFRVNFKTFVQATFEEAKGAYAAGRALRGWRQWNWVKRKHDFDPQVHIGVNVSAPPAPAIARVDARDYRIVIYFTHPAGTALNYGLQSPQTYVPKGKYFTATPGRSWASSWRYKSRR